MTARFYMAPTSQSKVLDESEAHRAYIAQLREERDRRGAPVLQFPDTTMQGVLDEAEERGDVRRFTGDTLTGFGDIGERGFERWLDVMNVGQRGSDRYREVMDEERAYQLREERAERDEAGL